MLDQSWKGAFLGSLPCINSVFLVIFVVFDQLEEVFCSDLAQVFQWQLRGRLGFCSGFVELVW